MFVRVRDAVHITALEEELARERERSRRLEAQLRNLADHDPLTDLLNRRSAEHELELHLARCTRYGPEGALLLVGVEGLDAVARERGRAVADEALAVLAERVTARLRTTDVTARWGPGELAVLLPRAAPAEVAVVVDALVGVTAATGTPRVPPGSLGASVGVAPVIALPVQPAELVDRAARALQADRRRWTRVGSRA